MAGIAALSLCYVLSQFFRSFLAVLSPALIAELGATKSDLALASGGFFISFGLMQFAVGVALDRYGPRRTASLIFGVFAGSGGLLFAMARTPLDIILAMGLFGIACAPVLMASYFIFARNFSSSRFALLSSALLAFGMSGNVVSASPLAWASEAFGWRWVIAGLGIVSAVMALIIFVSVRDPQTALHQEGAGLSGYARLFKDPRFWPLFPMMAISYTPVAGIRGLWAGPFLHDVYLADASGIGSVTLVMALGMISGSLLYGPMDRWFGSIKWVIFGGNLVSLAALMFLAAFPQSGLGSVTIAMVCIGLFGISYAIQMAHGRSFLPAELVGRGVTMMNFFNIMGVGIMQFLTGALVTAFTDPAEPQAAYQALFGFYAVLLIAALAIFAFSQDAVKAPATG
jgi:predicted MFS family arabinose efflux permease